MTGLFIQVNTYLDAESIAIAARIGNGNVNEGIRKALKFAADSACPPDRELDQRS